jgi:alkanesulfonate monooxygenase SsuD/methylene tetrahydromethanopterin reductase-like flavin-dependent oxidoreductase (luciferase family)
MSVIHEDEGTAVATRRPEAGHVHAKDVVRRKFGVMVYPDAPRETLFERFRQAEALGFDQVFVPDHSGDLRDLSSLWFDSLGILAVATTQTESIRLGTLVANPILRPPSELAKWARTIDHLSGGRLDLGIGAGLFPWDHAAVGEEPWSAKERAGRFADYVAIVDGILRRTGEPFTYEGERLWVKEVATAPGPVQRPRPPIIVGGQSPTILRTAAGFADVWNTIGPMGASAEEILDATARQNRQLDALCEAAGRDPRTLRWSYATFGPFDTWEGPVPFAEVVERFGEIGMTEFVIDWPPAERMTELERLARDVIPTLRET